MKITVLGPGCARCERLEKRARAVVAELGADATLEKIEEYAEIARRGVMSTPALAIDGTVVASGRVPSAGEISEWLQQASARGEG